MATLISNMPAEEVWVRKEYLTDFQSGHGEFTPGVWVSCKSMPGRAFYFETSETVRAELASLESEHELQTSTSSSQALVQLE